MRRQLRAFLAATCFITGSAFAADDVNDRVWIDSLDLSHLSQRRGQPRANRSIRDLPISLGGVAYARGVGTRSISEFVIDLKDGATRFEAVVGIDDVVKTGVGSVTFEVWADDTLVAASGLVRAGEAPKKLAASLDGARVLTLRVDDGGDTSNDDEVAWADAYIVPARNSVRLPAPYTAPPEAPPDLAPAAEVVSPAIHGPRVTGATPGRPFLFRIPATGKAPLRFAARGLPWPAPGSGNRRDLRFVGARRQERRRAECSRPGRRGKPHAHNRGFQ